MADMAARHRQWKRPDPLGGDERFTPPGDHVGDIRGVFTTPPISDELRPC
jgi:hypothetical protein